MDLFIRSLLSFLLFFVFAPVAPARHAWVVHQHVWDDAHSIFRWSHVRVVAFKRHWRWSANHRLYGVGLLLVFQYYRTFHSDPMWPLKIMVCTKCICSMPKTHLLQHTKGCGTDVCYKLVSFALRILLLIPYVNYQNTNDGASRVPLCMGVLGPHRQLWKYCQTRHHGSVRLLLISVDFYSHA